MARGKGLTPSQTVGPYFAYGLAPKDYDWPELVTADLATPDVEGERIRIEGRVFDGDGAPVTDAMVEIWQADAQGSYASPQDTRSGNAAFRGFGRCATDGDGLYAFETIRPGAVPGPDGKAQAPHVVVALFMRGLLTHLFTRIYFEGEGANAADPILALVPAARRTTLIAARKMQGAKPVYRFDIHMQGDRETVFFDI